MDRFEQMRSFVRVVECGSISAAAEQLDIAKSAVSRRLAALEQRLGAQLLRRNTRRLSLTESGRSYYERSRAILEQVDAAELSVSAAAGTLSGRLRISAPLSFGIEHLTPAILDFRRDHPALTVDIDFNDRRVDLLEEDSDLAIRIGRLPDSSLVARRIATIRHVVCASPGYWRREGRPQSPEELAGHECLLYTLRNEPAAWQWRAADGREGRVAVRGRLRANNGEFLRRAGIDGLGVIMQPTFIVWEALADGRLEAALREYEWFPVNAYAVYPRARHLSARVRVFVDYLAQRFGDRPYWDQA